ncbi:MAG: phospholipase D-like domain-containing protein [Akkermansiaceae bacterium]
MGKSSDQPKGILADWLGLLSADGSALHTAGNRVKLYFEGNEAFLEMREAIEMAERFVHLEMYLFLSDEVGHAIADSLSGAA